MDLSLRQIYNKERRSPGWYKTGKEAKCPNKMNTISVAESYWNEFGCSPFDQKWQKEEKLKAAKTCASERMADMDYYIRIGEGADQGHIRPIAIAYSLGKQCIEGNKDSYINQFRNWYKELVERSAQTHALFQTELETNEPYPLESFNPDTNGGIIAAQRRNPIISGSTPLTPKSDSSNNMNWKTTPKKTSKKKSKRTKTKKQRRS